MKNEINESAYHPYNEIVFECSGRRFKADCTIIGLSEGLNVYHGGDILASTTPSDIQSIPHTKQTAFGLTKEESIELADAMIARWEDFIEKTLKDSK